MSWDDEHQGLVDVCVPILIIMLLGWALGFFGVLHENWKVSLNVLNKVVFYVSIPATVIFALSTKDFTKFDWDFLLLFMWLRLAGMFFFSSLLFVAASAECVR
jgi:predicted permease